jgi:hypothetical protein
MMHLHQDIRRPVLRRPTSTETIAVDYEGGPRFLIDAPVYPG